MTDRRCYRCGAPLPRHYDPCPATRRTLIAELYVAAVIVAYLVAFTLGERLVAR